MYFLYHSCMYFWKYSSKGVNHNIETEMVVPSSESYPSGPSTNTRYYHIYGAHVLAILAISIRKMHNMKFNLYKVISSRGGTILL